jgi:hypothetical protein
MFDVSHKYSPLPGTDAWTLAAAGESPAERVYRKEVIYAGKFLMQNGDGERFESEVDDAALDHWADTHAKMLAAGIEVPLPIEHTSDPEKRRGTVVKLAKEINSRGESALFAYVKFRDAEAEKAFKHSDVSLYSPPSFTDGNGQTYYRPVRHLALTDYPVIPKLDKFHAVSLSLSGASKMPALQSLAKKLGISLEAEDNDAAISSKILAAFKAAKKGGVKKDPKLSDPPVDPPAPEPKPDPVKPTSVSPLLLSSIKDSRQAKLDKLVAEHRITPAVRDDLVKQYLADAGITACLSDSAVNDGFDGLIVALAKNEPVIKGEQTGPQVLELGVREQQGEENPLVADMERRAKAYAAAG